jgi:hypothetical protein
VDAVDTNSYVMFLLLGTLLVVLDGQIIYRNGRRFLRNSAPSSSAESMTRLVSTLFHILVLGVLALISTIDVPADTATEAVVIRLGIVLIIIGIAHFLAVMALSRIRDREEFDELAQEREARRLANEEVRRITADPSAPVSTVYPVNTTQPVTSRLEESAD